MIMSSPYIKIPVGKILVDNMIRMLLIFVFILSMCVPFVNEDNVLMLLLQLEKIKNKTK